MKIVLVGCTGMIGQRILNEALSRGHHVVAVARDPGKVAPRPNLEVKQGDAFKPDTLAPTFAGADVVVTAISPPKDQPRKAIESVDTLTQAINAANKTSHKSIRLIMVGGAASLEVAPGKVLLDQPGFPEAWKPIASAHREALGELRKAPIDWSYFSPATFIQPGERTGKYRTGGDQLVTDAKGESRISCEDYAVAMLDEIEKPQFLRKRFTAAY